MSKKPLKFLAYLVESFRRTSLRHPSGRKQNKNEKRVSLCLSWMHFFLHAPTEVVQREEQEIGRGISSRRNHRLLERHLAVTRVLTFCSGPIRTAVAALTVPKLVGGHGSFTGTRGGCPCRVSESASQRATGTEADENRTNHNGLKVLRVR